METHFTQVLDVGKAYSGNLHN